MIDIPELGDAHHETWSLLMNLSEESAAPWTLIGAHMVLLHLWAAGRDIQRATQDADILVDIRAVADGTERLSRQLLELGFDLPAVSPNDIGHRFVRGQIKVDILAPDNIGQRANVTTVRPFRTVRVPGGLDALYRTTSFDVRSRDTVGEVFAPDLLGAIVATVRAIDVDDAPDDKRSDTTLLLSAVEDAQPLVNAVTKGERKHLRHHAYFADPQHAVWDAVDRPELGASVFARLADL